MQREPLLTVASVTSAVVAVLALLTAFGLNLTEAQTAAILGVVGVAAPMVVAAVTRPKVTPIPEPRRRRVPGEGGHLSQGANLAVIVVGILAAILLFVEIFGRT